MSRIVFDDNYVIVSPTFNEVIPHKHSFLHIFFLWEDDRCSKLYIVGSGMLHTMPHKDKCRLFLMIDPTSVLAEYLTDNILTDNNPCMLPCENELALTENMSDRQIKDNVAKWLTSQFFLRPSDKIRTADERIAKLVCEIRDYKHLEDTISDIAKQCCLSESRLSHIFKESMGISLKGYLSLSQVRYAYKLITEGKSITYAALEAGFGSSAHLAAVCKSRMGISVSGVIKTADF